MMSILKLTNSFPDGQKRRVLPLITTVFLTTFVSGCCTTPINIPHPVCDEIIPVNEAIWASLDQMREVMSDNSLAYQECIAKYKQRINLFNET